MSQNILIAIAWPYANSDIHVGNITGSHLPGDICARYHRLRGRDVLMVSGSDAHGTAITIKADAQGKTPKDIYHYYHPRFLELFQRLGISYDLFTSTHTSTHFDVAQKVFLALKENGFLTTAISKQWYSPSLERFLPDRYVEGTCYICGNPDARADQCEKCGNVLEAELLLDPRSKLDNHTPELRETEHFYLDLSSLEPQIQAFLEERASYWRPNVLRQSLGQIDSVGLKPTPITRDLEWGIPVPLEGWDGKCLYVWFEAVMGYLSSSVEYAKILGDPELWRKWWVEPDTKAFYYIGKDNITFHAVTWPAELLGMGPKFDEAMGSQDPKPLVLPYNVPANEFMNLEGRKISGSKNWAVWGLDVLDRYDADAVRYYLTASMPETKDSDWDWEEFYQRNNNELLATWGNLVNRVLSFTYKNFEGKIPNPESLRAADNELLDKLRAGFDSVAEKLEAVQLKAALSDVMGLAGEVNKYLDVQAPWFEIKADKDEAARSLFTAIQAIDWLKIMFAPFLPHISEKLHAILCYSEKIFGEQQIEMVDDPLDAHEVLRYIGGPNQDQWFASQLVGGKAFEKPIPLVTKLDHKIVEEERNRLG